MCSRKIRTALFSSVLSAVFVTFAVAEPFRFAGSDSIDGGGVTLSSSWGVFESPGTTLRFADVTVDAAHPFPNDEGGFDLRPAIKYNHVRTLASAASFSATGSFLVPGTLDEFREVSMEMTFLPTAVDAFGDGKFSEMLHQGGTAFVLPFGFGLTSNDVGLTHVSATYRFSGPSETKEGVLDFSFVPNGSSQFLDVIDTAGHPSQISLSGENLVAGVGVFSEIVDEVEVWFGLAFGGGQESALNLFQSEGPLGDTDFDGVIDMDDLNNVRNNFSFGRALGDTDGNGVVDLEDLNNVRNNFGYVSPGQAVPEPASMTLCVLAVGAAWAVMRKQAIA